MWPSHTIRETERIGLFLCECIRAYVAQALDGIPRSSSVVLARPSKKI